MNKKIYFYLSLIVILAFLLRFYKVTEIPPSLNWDEVSIAYNAYSVLKTGKDEWGQFLPIHFKSYGEYKLPAQIYFSIPGIYLFGLNELGVRITPVIYGTLTILLIFLVGRQIFLSSTIGLISALLLAISPWHIHLTRASFESSFAVFWVCLGIWFFVKGFEKQKYLFVSTLPLAASVFTYNTARIFTPLFFMFNLIFYYNYLVKFKKTFILTLALFIILLLPIAPFVLSGEGSARYKLVSITDDPGLVLRINEARGNSSLPEPLPQLVHNKITYTSLKFTEHYLSHFTPDFLFLSGAPHKQHHVQNIGQLYLFQAPFLILGIYLLIKKKNKYTFILFSWVLLAFIPVAATNDSIPHALRTLIAVPFYQLVTAFGLYEAFVWIRNKRRNFSWVFLFGLIIVIILSLIYYLNLYYDNYPKNYSRDWQFGYKQVVSFIKKNYDSYDLIVFSRHFGEPHMFTLFFLNYDPAKFQNDPTLNRFETYNWIRVLNFDKFYFPDLGDKGTQYKDIINQYPDKKILFIGKEGDFPQELNRLGTVRFLNGNIAFEIVEKK